MFDTSTLLVLFLFGTLLLYRWLIANFKYFKDQGIPGPTPIPLFGTWWGFWKLKVYEVELERYAKYGPIYGIFDGRRPNLVIGDPSLIRKILVSDFDCFTNRRKLLTNNQYLNKGLSALQDEEWKAVRRIMTPAFTSAKIKHMHKIMAECAQALVQNLNLKTSEQSCINIKAAVNTYTLDIIASCAFGTSINPYHTIHNAFVTTATKIFSPAGAGNPIFTLLFLYPQLARILIPASIFRELNFFATLSQEIVNRRRSATEKRHDFLDLLLDAAKEDGEGYQNPLQNDVTLVAQVVIFLLAGFDTTALTISLTLHFLAMNQELQVKVREEMRTHGLKHDNISYDSLSDLTYTEQCINETLRLCPPAIRIERMCKRRVGYESVSIEAGNMITIPILAIHRDPIHYPDPLTYDPNRFSEVGKLSRDPMTFLPFGAGMRQCIGMRFALTEVKLCLYHLISNFKFFPIPETIDPITFDRGSIFGLLQTQELWLGCEKLNS